MKEKHVSGIIDWERAMWGEALMDDRFRRHTRNADFLKGFGKETFTEAEMRRIYWYDILLYLTMMTEGAYREYRSKTLIKIAICDDEPKICSLYQTKVQFILKEHGTEASIDTYAQPLEFLEALKVQEYDLMLLDIDMPEMSGLQIAEKIQELPKKPLLIFVTNQDALVYQTFLYHPFSFIRKSFLDEELEIVLFQALKELAGRKIRYTFRCEKETVSLLLHEILYLEAEGNYIQLHTRDGIYRFRETLASVERELEQQGFVRIHKGFLVNQEAVYRIGSDEVILLNKERLPIGRSSKEQAKERLMRYLLT